MSPDLIPAAEAAIEAGLSRERLVRLVQSGRLQAVRDESGRYLVSRQGLRSWIVEQEARRLSELEPVESPPPPVLSVLEEDSARFSAAWRLIANAAHSVALAGSIAQQMLADADEEAANGDAGRAAGLREAVGILSGQLRNADAGAVAAAKAAAGQRAGIST
jgi:hypothetical protein